MSLCPTLDRLFRGLLLIALFLPTVATPAVVAQRAAPATTPTGMAEPLPHPAPSPAAPSQHNPWPTGTEAAPSSRNTAAAFSTQQFLPLVLAQGEQRQSPLGLQTTLPFGVAPLSVTLSATLNGNPLPGDNPYHFTWQWGDGTGTTGNAAEHIYATPGVYTVTLTVYNLPDVQTLTQRVVVYDPKHVTLGQVDARGGVVTANQGDLWLEFAAGAVAEPYHLFIEQIDLTTVTTDTIDGLPALVVPGFGLPYRQISLYAARVRDSLWLTQTLFAAPVTMTHVYSAAVVDTLLPESLHFVYLNEQTGVFEPVSSTVDIATGQVRTVLTHFSDYGVAGDQAAWQTPTLDAAEVSLAKGQSSYAYALPLPKGPAGFQPQVNLSYSSSQPNSMVGDKNSDGGWVGVGWTLDLGQISADNLSLNGVGGELRQGSDGFYYVEEDPSLRIQRIDQPLPVQAGVTGSLGAYRWEVTDKAGTVYFFGKEADGMGSALSYRRRLSGSECQQRFSAYKLGKVVDVHGNTLTIDYQEIANPDGCGSHVIPVIRESYPRTLRYTTNAQNNDAQAEYVVEFVAEPKGYTAVERSVGDGNYRLTRIDVWHNPLAGGERQRVRSVAFDYTVNATAKTSLLSAVTLVGADGVTRLPALQLGYAQHAIGYNNVGRFQRPFLSSVRNGYGGEVQFAYQSESWSGRSLFQVVSERRALDAITQLTSTRRYAYAQARIKLGERCISRTPDGECNDHIRLGGFDRFFGFAQADVAEPLGRWQRHRFHNEPGSLRNGRTEATYTYAGVLGVTEQLYAASQPQWAEGTTPANVKFLYQSQSRSFTCFGQSGGQDLTGCLSTRTVSQVDAYGNPRQSTVYGADGQPHQTTVQVTEKHPTRWLFRPSEQRLHRGDQTTPTSQLTATTWRYTDERWSLPSVTRTWAGNDSQGAAQYLDTSHEYDVYGNAISATVYNSYGTVNTLANSAARTTRTTYDSQGLLPIEVTNPLSQTVVTVYDYRFQTPTQVTDANGATTATRYDTFGRLTGVDLPLCAAVVQASYGDNAYSSSGQPYFERLRQRSDDCTAAASYTELYVFYSGLGRKLQAQSNGDQGDTVLTQAAYDATGRLVRSGVPYRLAAAPGQYRPLNPDLRSWPTGFTQTEYDALDRPVRVTAPDGSVTRQEYGWDTTGDGATPTQRLLTRSVDANGHRTDQVRDEWGNLLRVREYRGVDAASYQLYGELAYTYDVQNRLTAVRDAAGNTTELTYDVLGRKTHMLDPDMGEWHYIYDALGNLVSQTDAAQTVTRLTYDALNRLTRKQYELPAGSTVAPAPAVSYFYDRLTDGSPVPNGIGRRVQMDDGLGSVTWQYDLQGRVLSEARTFSGRYAGLANTQDNGAYVTRYQYNAADAVVSMTYPDGEVVTNGYTPRGLPQWERGSMVGEITLDSTYNELGQLTHQTSDDGLTTSYTYYPATRAQNRLKEIRVGSGELNLAYTYDAVGNITTITDASTSVQGERLVYTYDHLDRLTQATATGGALAGYDLSYEYDAVGNLTARSSAGQKIAYQYGGTQPHAVTAAGADRYAYDNNGNMATRSEDGITYTQRWNPFNKLAQVRWQRDGQECNVQFVYDGDGNRLLKISGQASLEITTYYGGPLYEKQFNTTANPLGERMPAGASGNALAACMGGSTGVTDYGFTGQRSETEFGLMDFNARFYSPKLARFIKPDSIVPDPTELIDYNRYMYTRGNPVKYADPTGHFSEEQLTEWYGESWQSLFTEDWIKLLLDSPDSQIAGAQLGDLVVMGNGDNLIQGIFVMDTEGELALWDVNNKTPIDVAASGSGAYDTLALYRLAGGETGSPGARFDYLAGKTQYLSGVNGNGAGPYTMKLVGEYSTNPQVSSLSLASDWFIGRDQLYYVHNYMQYQSFDWWALMGWGGGTTALSASATTVDIYQTKGVMSNAGRTGAVATFLGAVYTAYSATMYRPVYELQHCTAFGPAYCR